MIINPPISTSRPFGHVTADLLKRGGMNVELQEMDLGTMLGRRMRNTPPGEGGWIAYPIGSVGSWRSTPR